MNLLEMTNPSQFSFSEKSSNKLYFLFSTIWVVVKTFICLTEKDKTERQFHVTVAFQIFHGQLIFHILLL